MRSRPRTRPEVGTEAGKVEGLARAVSLLVLRIKFHSLRLEIIMGIVRCMEVK